MNHRPTLNTLLALGCALATGAATAGPRVGSVVGAPSSTSSTVHAKVISATPVVAQVAVPRQVCRDDFYQEPARSSGAGALLGDLAPVSPDTDYAQCSAAPSGWFARR